MKSKTLILGIGNEILGDDAVGIKVGKYFRKMNLPIDIEFAGITGLRLLDYIQGYDKLVIVDALEINYDDMSKYSVRVFTDVDLLDNSVFYSAHDTSLGMALKLAKESHSNVFPKIIKIVAIEIPYQHEYSSELSPQTKKLMDESIVIISNILREFNITL